VSADVFARLRDLNKADQHTPVWKPACSGEGDQPWSVTRRTPGEFVPVEFDQTANGRIRHYSLEGAVARAECLNDDAAVTR
jgi:ferredoxin-NADP reductase